MCNPGGAAALLCAQDEMKLIEPGATRKQMEQSRGQELGVVRISLGLASSFEDARKVIQFAEMIGDATTREEKWSRWIHGER